MGQLKTILLVDDEADIVSAMEFFLSRRKVEVLSAANGKEALQVILEASRKPDLILLDGNMPTMNAEQFLKIRKLENIYPSIPVVILSSDFWNLTDPTILGHIPKPFDVIKMLDKIEKLYHVHTQEVASSSP